jgi:hypothetical protein
MVRRAAGSGPGYPLTAPAVRPETTARRKTSTRIAIGSIATAEAAKIVP